MVFSFLQHFLQEGFRYVFPLLIYFWRYTAASIEERGVLVN
jgi:hypothetical protein